MSANPIQCCATCDYWTLDPQLANALRRPDGADPDVGACQLRAPIVVIGPHATPMSMFPEVRIDRFCGSWERGTGSGGDGGPSATNVVPMRGAS